MTRYGTASIEGGQTFINKLINTEIEDIIKDYEWSLQFVGGARPPSPQSLCPRARRPGIPSLVAPVAFSSSAAVAAAANVAHQRNIALFVYLHKYMWIYT